jgi:hypothetical protein
MAAALAEAEASTEERRDEKLVAQMVGSGLFEEPALEPVR